MDERKVDYDDEEGWDYQIDEREVDYDQEEALD